jgi:hypothetical protein
MNVEKIESLLLRLISKEFPFVKKVKFGVDRSKDVMFILYVNPIEIRNTFKVKIDYDFIRNGGPSSFLDYLFDLGDDDSEEVNSFLMVCNSLDDLAENLSSPFAEEYGKIVGLPDNNRITSMYDSL